MEQLAWRVDRNLPRGCYAQGLVFTATLGVLSQTDLATASSRGTWVRSAPATASLTQAFRGSDVDEYTFRHQDVLILFAVGNEGVDGVGSASEPSTAKNALAVGASMAPDQLWQQLATPCPESASGLPCQESMAAFSSIGPTYDGR